MARGDRTKKRRRWLIAAVSVPVVGLGFWAALHTIPGFAPWASDTARSVLGNERVSRLQDLLYGAEDQVNLVLRADEEPKAYWPVPVDSARALPVPPLDESEGKEPKLVFSPKDVEPMFPDKAAPGDGRWVAMPDATRPDEPALQYKTLVHPDRKRPWAALAVVAIDLRQVDIQLVPGTHEPEAKTVEARTFERTGLIPKDDVREMISAFNGGFKTTHGNYGVVVGDTTFVKPRAFACTIGREAPGRLSIVPWKQMSDRAGEMTWLRQTPMCMVEDGELHPGLVVEDNTHWGATVNRDTVIRRSAMGLSADKNTLFVSIGDSVTATAIAKGMKHVGADHVAQLDVNHSYPKFLTFEPNDAGELKAVPLTECPHSEDDYVREPSPRDFFYVVRREASVEGTQHGTTYVRINGP